MPSHRSSMLACAESECKLTCQDVAGGSRSVLWGNKFTLIFACHFAEPNTLQAPYSLPPAIRGAPAGPQSAYDRPSSADEMQRDELEPNQAAWSRHCRELRCLTVELAAVSAKERLAHLSTDKSKDVWLQPRVACPHSLILDGGGDQKIW